MTMGSSNSSVKMNMVAVVLVLVAITAGPCSATTPIGSAPEPDRGDLGIQEQREGKKFCIVKPVEVDDKTLEEAIDYACATGSGVDCSPIKPGGACYEPNNKRSHTQFAMHSLFVVNNGSASACSYHGAFARSTVDPSNYHYSALH
ncbi:Glucan endo-1,3-beta-glucosidase [Melia azedarach]|uniref:Glucan endo-1,3-beta-glucosidase n=1 Tax=Melia azedarach TaxID=155640 RepID=A0ACC1Y625_MELAZ|nr:Glucan endo-1,3-beta-glucosidase [Melia azedarach]